MPDPSLAMAQRRARQLVQQVRSGGPRLLAASVLRKTADRLAAAPSDLRVRPEDVIAASNPPRRPSPPRSHDRPLDLTFVITPPTAGSGGHTTLFRLARHLEACGHTCRLAIYDPFCPTDARTAERAIREHFPPMRAGIVNAIGELVPTDALIATSWPTAYVVQASPIVARRFYVVQDFEPTFYAVGSQAALAENTYRLGLHGLTAGRWLAKKLNADYGMACDHFDFGADTSTYRLLDDRRRTGVVFYARPSAPRRGFELGTIALALFAQMCPEVDIHLVGEDLGNRRLPFRYVDHGVLTTAQLNELYNQCAAGLVISLTNLSLLPQELLAAGCLPVVTDGEHNRMVYDNPLIRYVPTSPEALAVGLRDAVAAAADPAVVEQAATSVAGESWEYAGKQVEAALLRELSNYSASDQTSSAGFVQTSE